MGRVLSTVVAGLIFSAVPAMAQTGFAKSCHDLADLKLDNGRITTAEHVAPGWKPPKSLFNWGDSTAKTSFCRVTATVEKEIRIEVWLPDIWNQRFEGVGNGGLSGDINYVSMAQAVTAGFATASTDTGHVTAKTMFDSDWVAGHPDRVENFAHRGHHLMAVTAKKIVAAYYGAPASKNYFTGCSSGGWQALTEAQRYPEDYDGIVAGAPANNFVRLQSNGFYYAYVVRQTPGGDLSAEKQQMLVKAMVTMCDAKDGLKDGIITDPRLCKFDFKKLQCRSGDGPDCLTKAQVKRVSMLYGPRMSKKGLKLYPGQPLGVPPVSIFARGDHDPFYDTMMILALKQRPSWSTATFDPDHDIAPIDKELGPMLNSTNPDLNAFKARGGKLVLYHGWGDPGLSPYNSLDYFEAVQRKVPDTDGFMRLFLIPTMGHCGGGDGPNSFDSNSAIVNWVEKGEAPDALIGTHIAADGSYGMTRPLCAEPKIAVYKGAGATDDAANFICRKPQDTGLH